MGLFKQLSSLKKLTSTLTEEMTTALSEVSSGSALGGESVTRPADAVDGQAQITAVSSPHVGTGTSVFTQGRFHAVIDAPGIPAFPVEITKIVRTANWPTPGAVLPCWVSRSDPRSFAVDFGALPNHADQARQQAAAQAAMLRGEPPVVGGRDRPGGLSTDNPFTGTKAQFAGGTAADLPPEALARLEEALGIDLDGNGVVGGKPSPSPDRATNGKGTTKDTDSDERLRRLAQLHSLYKDGALTAEEFASEKRRLLED